MHLADCPKPFGENLQEKCYWLLEYCQFLYKGTNNIRWHRTIKKYKEIFLLLNQPLHDQLLMHIRTSHLIKQTNCLLSNKPRSQSILQYNPLIGHPIIHKYAGHIKPHIISETYLKYSYFSKYLINTWQDVVFPNLP